MKRILYILTSCTLLLMFGGCSEDTFEQNGFGTLTGFVVAADGNLPLANVKITTNPTSNTVFTDDLGAFIIEDISTGDYSVQAELDDFIVSFEAATIITGGTTNLVFELEERTGDNVPPNEPILIFPLDNSTDVALSVDFLWIGSDDNDDELTYTLEVRNGSTNEIQLFENLQDTTYTVANLTLATTYFWQVKADDDIAPVVQSSISSFTTSTENLNRFLYTREEDNGNFVIYSGNDTNEDGEENDPNEDEFALTDAETNSFKPRKNRTNEKIAFLRTVGTAVHLFSMNSDGSGVDQLTSTVPVAGFRNDEIEFDWFPNGEKLYYPNFNRLYSINADGSGTTLVWEADPQDFITEVATNEFSDFVVLKLNNAIGYNAKIIIIDPTDGGIVKSVVEGEPGAIGGIDFSIDGQRVLYTQDITGFENVNYRQLDTRIFEFDFDTSETIELSIDKINGTNDLDVKYSPDEGSIIVTNTSNDNLSIENIYVIPLGGSSTRELVFTNASMPDWQ